MNSREKRKKGRIEKASAEARKKYEDYDWNAMLNDGSLTKQTVAVLRHHQLKCRGNRKAKLCEVLSARHITHQLHATDQPVQEQSASDCADEDHATFSSCDEDEDKD